MMLNGWLKNTTDMETKFKFNSAICTSRSQSERLLALGLKKETADMVLLKEMVYDEENHCTRDGEGYLIRPIEYLEGEEHRGHIPAWSLHRLLCLIPKEIELSFGKWVCININYNYNIIYLNDNQDDFVSFCEGSIYDKAIDCIEWLIKEGYFNKEYLV